MIPKRHVILIVILVAALTLTVSAAQAISWNHAETWQFILDSEVALPTYSDVGTNTTVAGQSCLFHTEWTDNVNMSGYVFGTNNTGSWSNETWSGWSPVGTPKWSNITKTLNSAVGCLIQWQIWANDTADNWNNTGLQSLTTIGWNFAESWSFSLNAISDWSFVETWSFTLNSGASWHIVETWNFTLLSMSQWNLVESWNFTLNATSSWSTVESWNFTLTTGELVWHHIETWNFTLTPPAFIFHGLFDESTGYLYPPSERAVNVTAYYSDGNTTRTFEVNGTYAFYSTSHPLYFRFELGSHDREYWVRPDEENPVIYIFNQTLTTYTISFLDLAGALTDHPFVEAQRYINGTLMTVEKRKVDVENKIVMSLVNGVKYTITLQDGASYTFGDLLMTSQTTIQLTLKGIAFPKETLLTYKNVRIYGTRVFADPNGTITITYQDLLNLTNSVKIYINYKNGTNIYTYTETTDSFNHEWSNALNNTDYTVSCTIDHGSYGVYSWRQYFPLHLSSMPWSLDWLGTSLPFNTAYLIPAFLILFVGGCFSVINAEVGAFMMVVVAIIIVYMGWLPIPAAALVVAFTLAVIMAIIYAKRKVLT